MNPYAAYVDQHAGLIRLGRSLPLGTVPPPPRPPVPADAPKVLIFSPHPDDECIIGGLALRLLRQCGWNIINIAVTQGSNKARQAERLQELTGACAYLGFGLESIPPAGLENIYPKEKTENPAHWARCVAVIRGILETHRPKALFIPHDADRHPGHLGTHHLVMDALAEIGPALKTPCHRERVLGTNQRPNLMVECTPADAADLIAALTYHIGEVQRNPYHLTMPSWLTDNVRRGSELVGGQGGASATFTYATLYRASVWDGVALKPLQAGGRILPASENPAGLFAQA